MPLPTAGNPISFDDLNTEMPSQPSPTSTLDIDDAGIAFGLNVDPAKWSDTIVGLGMDEFQGLSGVWSPSTVIVSPSHPSYQFVANPTGPGWHIYMPGTSSPTAVIPAGGHSIPHTVEISGSSPYSVQTNPIQTATSSLASNPSSGLGNAITPATYTIGALPYNTSTETQERIYFTYFIQGDPAVYPPTSYVSDKRITVRRKANNQAFTITPQPVPSNAGTHTYATVKWRFGSAGSILNSNGPAPGPDTAPWALPVTATKYPSNNNGPVNYNYVQWNLTAPFTENTGATRTTYAYFGTPASIAGGPGVTNYPTWGPLYSSQPTYQQITIEQDGAPAGYSLTPTPTSIDEGVLKTFTFTATGGGIPNQTLYWNLSPPGAGDFSAIQGTFPVTSNTGTFNVTSLADQTTEGPETFTVRVRNTGYSGPILATAALTVNDTSLDNLQLSPTLTPRTLDGEGASVPYTISGSPTIPWSITLTGDAAYSVSPSSGTGPGTFSVSIAANATPAPRDTIMSFTTPPSVPISPVEFTQRRSAQVANVVILDGTKTTILAGGPQPNTYPYPFSPVGATLTFGIGADFPVSYGVRVFAPAEQPYAAIPSPTTPSTPDDLRTGNVNTPNPAPVTAVANTFNLHMDSYNPGAPTPSSRTATFDIYVPAPAGPSGFFVYQIVGQQSYGAPEPPSGPTPGGPTPGSPGVLDPRPGGGDQP